MSDGSSVSLIGGVKHEADGRAKRDRTLTAPSGIACVLGDCPGPRIERHDTLAVLSGLDDRHLDEPLAGSGSGTLPRARQVSAGRGQHSVG
jgi:hypothetical protein